MGAAKTIFATAFKATCLHVLDRVQSGEWPRVEVTKGGGVCGRSAVLRDFTSARSRVASRDLGGVRPDPHPDRRTAVSYGAAQGVPGSAQQSTLSRHST
jgi:hypothetical protein